MLCVYMAMYYAGQLETKVTLAQDKLMTAHGETIENGQFSQRKSQERMKMDSTLQSKKSGVKSDAELGQDTMWWRTQHLAKTCRTLRENQTKYDLNETLPVSIFETLPLKLLISDRFELLSCTIAKIGSTNIARLLYTLEHLSKAKDASKPTTNEAHSTRIMPRKLKGEKELELQSKLNTYTRFIFIRDPFERIVSAYRAKLPGRVFKRGGLFFDKNVAFNEFFVKVVLDPPIYELDKPVMPFFKWCPPCSVKYDFVGQLNNFDEDINTILEHVGAKDILILPKRNETGYQEKKSSDVVEGYRRNVSKYHMKQFYEKFYLDYLLFGYPRPY